MESENEKKDLITFYVIRFKETKHNRKIIEKAEKEGKRLTKMDLISKMNYDLYKIPSNIHMLDLIYRYENKFGEHPPIGYGFEPNNVVEAEFLVECLFENHSLTKEQLEKIEELQEKKYESKDGAIIVY